MSFELSLSILIRRESTALRAPLVHPSIDVFVQLTVFMFGLAYNLKFKVNMSKNKNKLKFTLYKYYPLNSS